ncbi:TRL-like family protein [Helicobacter suis]|uniref:TRL-like family protein n=1 Tax=Helicobacter suis TaxID=104628 RepID=UPI001F07A41A|nr:TRL-like family protein [Helicobacter suis]
MPRSGPRVRSPFPAPIFILKACCISILSLFAFGNCSVKKAAKNGGIVQIKMIAGWQTF